MYFEMPTLVDSERTDRALCGHAKHHFFWFSAYPASLLCQHENFFRGKKRFLLVG